MSSKIASMLQTLFNEPKQLPKIATERKAELSAGVGWLIHPDKTDFILRPNSLARDVLQLGLQ